ncbi:uncharacterized protein LOC134229550 [Saccostrea cucullata]|uniref:uncharacterized protein LOC134229550 n=1 Tax=Saccostrea cuccullata TaxID=36930 RepID=UPI002ED2A09F
MAFMMNAVGLALGFLSFLQVHSFSIVTENGGQNITHFDINDIDAKNVDVFRQLLNQETIIRIGLVKNVHSLMKDMIDLKQSMKTLETSQQKTEVEVTALKQEVNELKRENERLKLENRRYEEMFSSVKENFTEMNQRILEFEEQFEDKREVYEKNTGLILGDLKVEVRYLSVTLLDLNKHTLELDKSIPALIEEKYDILSTKLNGSLEILNNDLLASSAKISTSVLNLENSQNTTISSMFDDLNKAIADLKTDAKKSHYEQLKLSSVVTTLEMFRMNTTRNKCDLQKSVSVAFTAGVTYSSTTWSGGTLVFDKVINNVGNGYNMSDGVFTAPTGGNYMFYVSIQSNSNRHNIWVDITINGSSKVRAIAEVYNDNDGYETGTNMVTFRLQQGDRDDIRKRDITEDMFQALVDKLQVITDENRELRKKVENHESVIRKEIENMTSRTRKEFENQESRIGEKLENQKCLKNQTGINDIRKRVAFTAGVTSSSSTWNSGTLVYSKVINKVGGGYNPSTGIFTAPVEGDYVFYVSIQSYYTNDIYIDIVLNGSSKVRAAAFAYSSDERDEMGSNLATLRLQKGDTVWVKYTV